MINANGILIVFDLGDVKSFNDLDSWLDVIKDTIDENNIIQILVGNKSDLSDIKITNEIASKYAKDHNMKYLSVSVKDGVNIESLFEMIGNDCIKKIQEDEAENDNARIYSDLNGQIGNYKKIGNQKMKQCC